MKLLGCHITNFGCFHDYDLTFTDGLNVIMQANGWGKSTLSAFIKAMLYGFSRKRVRDVSENERLRYTPWQGGTYGGSLDFEVQGRELRVIRTFGATAARDTLKVIDISTGRSAMSEIEGDVGEWLFGLDANAFQKSVYVVQNGFGFDGSMTGLRNRMNALVNEADDVAGFDKAQAKLDERRKHYKRTGNRGVIADTSRDVAKLVETSREDEAKVANLRHLNDQMNSYDEAIAEIDAQILELRKAAEEQQAQDQERVALKKVADQLENRSQDAQSAYAAALRDLGGRVPEPDEVEQARHLLVDAENAQQKSAAARAVAQDVQEKHDALLKTYPQGLPGKTDVRRMREQLAKLADLDASLSRELEEVNQGNGGANVQELLDKADDVMSQYKQVSSARDESADARRQAEDLRSNWNRLREQVVALQDEANSLQEELPDNADQIVEALRADSRELRKLNVERSQATLRVDDLQTQLRSAQSDLSELPEGLDDEAAAIAALDEASERLRGSIELANEARRAMRTADELVETARAGLMEAQGAVDEHKSAMEEPQKGLPVPTIACIAGGIAAIVAGVVMGPAGGTSFALYGVGVVLVVLGLLLMRKKSPSQEEIARSEELAQALRNAQEADTEAKEQARLASECSAEANKASDAARGELANLVRELFPGEAIDESAIEAQVPVFTQRLASHRDQRLKIVELEQHVQEAQEQLDGVDERLNEISASYEYLQGSGEDVTDMAEQLEAYERKLSASIALANDCSGRLEQSLDQLIAASDVPVGWQRGDRGEKVSLDGLEPAGVGELEKYAESSRCQTEAYAHSLSEILVSFGQEGVEAGEVAVGVERLGAAVAALRAKRDEQDAKRQQLASREAARQSMRGEVDAWAREQGLASSMELTDKWFAKVDEDIASNERMGWELQRAKEEAERSEAAASTLMLKAQSACRALNVPANSQALQALDDLLQKAREAKELKQAVLLAQEEQRDWQRQHRDALRSSNASTTVESENPSARVAALSQQRDALVRERAQREEQQNNILESLERVLLVEQELSLLSKKKQQATSNLFTVQKTAEYLQRARDGLDGRYLGDLGDRFGDYANAWLKDEQVEAMVDGEFGVSLYDGSNKHNVVGYSTGYQDLLDVCFRMALIDTIFQAEPPFMVMDDPFVNLDQEKVARALQLLESLAQKYQIIYFTCHPSRMELGEASNDQTAFTLPKQQARRELPRARARREAQERAEAQAKLVASYEVVPVSSGKASIKPSTSHRTINNNLFTLSFEIDEMTGTKNNSFEVHFIDEQGRVLCDRQSVEVIDGHVVPEKVMFSLSTKDDSGSTYDLIVHEDDREQAQLAARIPFAADISFAADDFGF